MYARRDMFFIVLGRLAEELLGLRPRGVENVQDRASPAVLQRAQPHGLQARV